MKSKIMKRIMVSLIIICSVVALSSCKTADNTAISDNNNVESSEDAGNISKNKNEAEPLTLVAHNDYVNEYNDKLLKEKGYIASEPEFSWLPIDGGNTPEAVVANSAFIGRGKVISQEVVLDGELGNGGLIFTISKISIDKLYAVNADDSDFIQKNDGESKITISLKQDGGTIDDYAQLPSAEAPLLIKGVDYIFFLFEIEDGVYAPVGGRLGFAEVVNGKIVFLSDESATVFENLNGEKLSELAKDLAQYANDAPKVVESDIVVNTDEQKISDFLTELE